MYWWEEGKVREIRGRRVAGGEDAELDLRRVWAWKWGQRARQIGGFLYVEDMEIMFLRACGKFHSFDERNAHQAAVFVLLNQLVQATGMEICDYKYRTLGRRHFRNDNGRDVCARLWQRIEELEAKNKELKELVKSNESIFEYEVRRSPGQASVVQR
ncbi:hypothetical protein PIB30_084352 [Stylosanthes scabra]|uniref:Uncharacterized protein n=1 Tax=Stylosanthes scabra TaxID=79078 RepID=A0ABU6VSX2_9FABA|nr:hypothetical protein [Stylosanthes scabra]